MTGVDLARAEGGGHDEEPVLAAGGQLGQVRLLRRRRQEPQDGAARCLGAHQVRHVSDLLDYKRCHIL